MSNYLQLMITDLTNTTRPPSSFVLRLVAACAAQLDLLLARRGAA